MSARAPRRLPWRGLAALAGFAWALAVRPSLAATATGGDAKVLVEGSSEPAYLSDRFQLSLGWYFVSTKLKAELNGNVPNTGQPVNVSHDFDRDVNFNLFRADALWRITPRHRLRATYFGNNVTRSRTLDRDLEWGDYTFQANATLNARTSLGIYELAYEYAFLRRPTFELAAGAGIHTMDISIRLSGEATLTDANGNTSAASFSTSNSHLPAPLPVVSAHATWAVTPHIFIEPAVQLLKVNFDGYSGHWTDLRVAANWMFSRHFGLGVGYDHFHVDVDVSKPRFNGNLTTGYSGYQAMLVGSW